MMKPHNVGAAIRRAKVCYAWVWLNDEEGVFIQVSKTEARQVVDAAKEDKIEHILAFVKGKELFLGDDEETAVDGAAEEEEGGEEEEEEEEEEELGEEEEEELGEEEEEEEEETEETEEEEEAPPAKTAKKAK